MSDSQVVLLELESTKVAHYRHVGEQPEGPAIHKILEWAAASGLLAGDEAPRFFGFNNPDPSGDDPAYGYEFCMVVGEGTEGSEDVGVKDGPAGLYACSGPCAGIKELWDWAHGAFAQWCEAEGYEYDGGRQWLEEHIPDAGRLAELPALGGDERWQAFRALLPIKRRAE